MSISFLLLMDTSGYPQAMNPDSKPEAAARFLIEPDLWEDFRKAARVKHPKGRSPRAKVLREFIQWYVHRPGMKRPDRPAADSWSRPVSGDTT